MDPNGQRKITPMVDIGMRLVMPLESYEQVGKLMDTLQNEINAVLALAKAEGAFDFTSFNTHPCKTAALQEQMYERIHRAGRGTMPVEAMEAPGSDTF